MVACAKYLRFTNVNRPHFEIIKYIGSLTSRKGNKTRSFSGDKQW